MTNFRTKSVLILVALLAGASGSVTPASAASFSPVSCFAPSGVSVTDGGALRNNNTIHVTVTCPIDKGGNGVLPFTWTLGYDDTTGMQTKCTYRRFTVNNPTVIQSVDEPRFSLTFPSEMGKGWISGSTTASSSFYHDIKCSLAPAHSITFLMY
jgi:hypothetical protein